MKTTKKTDDQYLNAVNYLYSRGYEVVEAADVASELGVTRATARKRLLGLCAEKKLYAGLMTRACNVVPLHAENFSTDDLEKSSQAAKSILDGKGDPRDHEDCGWEHATPSAD